MSLRSPVPSSSSSSSCGAGSSMYRVRRDYLEKRRQFMLMQTQQPAEEAEEPQQEQKPRRPSFERETQTETTGSSVAAPDDNNNGDASSNQANNYSPLAIADFAESFCDQPPPPSGPTHYLVTHAEGTTRVYLLPASCRSELAQLHTRLNRIADHLPQLPLANIGNVELRNAEARACVAYFPPEAGYFRARLVRVLAGMQFALVEFADFGNRCCLPACLVRRCPDWLAGLPPCAYRCQLTGLCHRMYDRVAGAWLSRQLTGRHVFAELQLATAHSRASDDAGSCPVKFLEPEGLLDGLPTDRPELMEFFSERHRENVRLDIKRAAAGAVVKSDSIYVGSRPAARRRYTATELLRIGVAATASATETIQVRPGRLQAAELTKRHAVVMLPGCSPSRVRVLQLEAFVAQFEALHSRLQYLYSELEQISRPLTACSRGVYPGAYCVAKMADGQSYRARVKSVEDAEYAIVRLVDLGSTAEVPVAKLSALLPEAADASPELALACAPLFSASLTPDAAMAELEAYAGRLLRSVRFYSTGASGGLLISFD